VDFRDITAAGASAPWSGTRLGNGLGNTNITFAAGKTVYWNLVAGGNWSATAWATSSGGTPATANFPLAQDTAVIDNTGLTTGNTITTDAVWWVSTVNSTRTNAWNYVSTAGLTVYGDFTIPSVTTVSGTSSLLFQGQGLTQTLTTNGVAFTMGFSIVSVNGTLVLNGAVTCPAAQTVTLSNGTLNLSSYTLTCGLFSSSGAGTRTIAFGTGIIVCSGASWTTTVVTGLTYTGSGTVSMTSASAKTFSGGGKTYGTLNQGGAGALTIVGANTFNDITNSYSATGATSILFTAGTTNTFSNWSATGTAGNLLTINSVTAATHTLSKASGIVSVDYLSITNSTATGGASWYAGANSINVSGNTGWIFSAPFTSSPGNFFFMF
jgi:hypothetical protein